MALLNRFRKKPARTIPWGPWDLPVKRREHFLLMGKSGSGKTLTLTQLYASILPHIKPKTAERPKECERALIYDKKGDTLPILCRLKERGLIHPDIPIYFFNPQDARTHAWDVRADVNLLPLNQLDGHIHRIVANLFPRPEKSVETNSSFYRTKAAQIAKCILHAFADADIRWTLRDVFAVLYKKEDRDKLLRSHPRGQIALEHCGDPDTARNLDATISTEITPHGELADLMQLAADRGRSFSIHDWLTRPSILVFSGTTNPDVPLAHLNRTFLTEFVECLTRRRDTYTDITWIFLDEAPSIGRQERFTAMLREGRSKGAAVFLGVQDIGGFRAALGDVNEAESVLAQIGNVAFFKLLDHESAEWASLRFGEGRRIDAMQDCVRVQRRFPYTEFQDLHVFSEELGLQGIFRAGDEQPHKTTIMPLLLKDLDEVPEEWWPLGSVPWPGDARPKPNLELERLLGSSLNMPPRQTNGRMPTTGRILPPSNE